MVTWSPPPQNPSTTFFASPPGVESYPDHSRRENGDSFMVFNISLKRFTMSSNF
jgi:hypothetical protein